MTRIVDFPLTVSLMITLALLMILLVLTATWRVKRSGGLGPTEQNICEPCSTHSQGSTLTNGLEQKDKQNEDKGCCQKTSSVIDLLAKTSTERFLHDFKDFSTAGVMKSDCKAKVKAVGKTAGIDFQKLTEEATEKDLVYYSENEVEGTISYTNASFSIQEGGFYFVFSQLQYGHDPESALDTEGRQSHYLYRYSKREGQTEKLLENTRSNSELRSAAANNGTSFIGAVFQLEEKDKLWIKTTHTHKLSGDTRHNFFGLYLI